MRINRQNPSAPDRRMAEVLLGITALTLLSSCVHIHGPRPGPFTASVNAKVVPKQATILTHGNPETVGASRDDRGVRSDFLEGIVLLKPKDPVELQSFLDRYDGKVIGD